jgi:dTDP-glucose 4,6-dehydratase
VADNVRAILTAAEKGVPGEAYNITTSFSLTNRQLVEMVANMMGVIPKIELVADRPGNDLRYAMTSAKLTLLGWRPEETFESGLRKTIEWYEKSKMWWSSKSTLPSKPADSR